MGEVEYINQKEKVICDYLEKSNNPCKTCPKLITALHSCKLLQEIALEIKPKI